jgi:hypothetical protein
VNGSPYFIDGNVAPLMLGNTYLGNTAMFGIDEDYATSPGSLIIIQSPSTNQTSGAPFAPFFQVLLRDLKNHTYISDSITSVLASMLPDTTKSFVLTGTSHTTDI